MKVFESQGVILDYDQIKKQLKQTWKGYSNSVMFREAINKTVSFVEGNEVNSIISDTLSQKVVAQEDTQYAVSAMPKLFSRGLKAMAFVIPQSALTKMSLKTFADNQQKANLQYFATIDEAEVWANSF